MTSFLAFNDYIIYLLSLCYLLVNSTLLRECLFPKGLQKLEFQQVIIS